MRLWYTVGLPVPISAYSPAAELRSRPLAALGYLFMLGNNKTVQSSQQHLNTEEYKDMMSNFDIDR